MDDVRSRLSSSGEGVLDLVGFTALYKRTVDYTSGMSGAIRSFGESSSPSTTIQFPEDSDEHSFHKKPIKEFSRVYTFLSTLLFCAVLIAENIVHFKLFKGYKAAVSLYWMQSCIIALLFRFWGRRRTGRFRSQASQFRPMIFFHVAVVTVFSVDFKTSEFTVSSGSSSYLVYLAFAPPMVVLASWIILRHCYPDKIIIVVAASSSLIMILSYPQIDLYPEIKVSFRDGVFGVVMSVVLGCFLVYAKRHLPKASSTQLLYLLNFSCVVCLPFIAVLLGELFLLWDVIVKRGVLDLILNLCIMALIRLASQAASLLQLEYSTPLLNVTTRGFSWIWITLGLALSARGSRQAELLISVFYIFWIYGTFLFLPVLLSSIFWSRGTDT